MVIGVVDAVFLMQPELDLHQHAGFLLQWCGCQARTIMRRSLFILPIGGFLTS